MGVYGQRNYVKKEGAPKTLAELDKHCLIGFDRDDWALRGLGALPRPVTRDNFGFRSDSDLAQFAALKAGAGIGGWHRNISPRFKEFLPTPAHALAFQREGWIGMPRRHKSTRLGPPVFAS